MLRLLELLLLGHIHEWSVYERKGVHDDEGVVVGEAVFCVCKKCGMPKRFNLY